MYLALLWFLAILCLSLPVWLLWNAWNKSRKLDSRLRFCDETLLDDSSVKIIQITAAPPGTTITENARFVVVPNQPIAEAQNMLFE